MKFGDYFDQAGLTPAEVKRLLPLEYALLTYDVLLEASGSGLTALCPFHPDGDNGSFGIYRRPEDDFDRWHCFGCGLGGDVFDAIRRLERIEFGPAFQLAIALLKKLEAEPGWSPSPTAPAREVSPDELQAYVEATQGDPDRPAIALVMAYKKLTDATQWLAHEFRFGADDELIIPHYSADGELVAYKHRAGYNKPISGEGSRLIVLYGEWRDRGFDRVILCEGESDTWKIAWTYRAEPVDVFGLPAGAHSKIQPAWVNRLAGRDVTLLFDGDTAGRTATRRWVETLLQMQATGNGPKTVRVADPGKGMDASDHFDVRPMIGDAVVVAPMDVAGLAAEGYEVLVRNQVPMVITNWWIEPTALVMGDDRLAVEGFLRPLGERVVVSPEEFKTPMSVQVWCQNRGLAWRGAGSAAQQVWDRIVYEATFTRHAKMVHEAGWHDGTFALPDREYIGQRAAVFVPRDGGDPLAGRIVLADRRPDRWTSHALVSLHRRDIVTPIIAWFAAAPLRNMVANFPVLAISGASGSGKTETTSLIAKTFGWGEGSDLGNLSRWAIMGSVTSSCGVPVIIDEYRLGGRPDGLEAVQAAVRSVWSRMPIPKGGNEVNAKRLDVYIPAAPLAIIGEDELVERSQVDRIAQIRIAGDGQHDGAFNWLKEQQPSGLGLLYLRWLVDRDQAGLLYARIEENDRHRVVTNTLDWGWDLFTVFSIEMFGYDPGALDLSGVNQVYAEAGEPYLELLLHGVETEDRKGRRLVWVDGEDVVVRPRALLDQAARFTEIGLPSTKPEALHAWLSQYGVVEISSRVKRLRRSDPASLYSGVVSVSVVHSMTLSSTLSPQRGQHEEPGGEGG
jgi:hypothetical protein